MDTTTKKDFHLVITGGTIDSVYDGTKDTVVPCQRSSLPEFFKSLKLYTNFDATEVCMKDSRDLTPADFQKIMQTIEDSFHKNIILTHGTYTMPDTARYLEANLKRKDQTIIITGSMIPIQGFSPSDAPFNLGFAVAKAEELPPGVYLSMNGKVFTADEAMKISKEGRFSSIFGE